jgi:AcrR family transcriptional regulator
MLSCVTDTPRRPRRTTVQLEHDIRTAVQEALLDSGYRGVTFEDIARRARVSKPVLYRRYPDRAAMVLDALQVTLHSAPAPEPTGSLRGDLITWFSLARDRSVLIGADTYRGLVGEADPAVLATIAGIGADAVTLVRDKVISPAVTRGELGQTPLPDEILSIPVRLVRDSILFNEVPPDIPTLVDTVALPLYQASTEV